MIRWSHVRQALAVVLTILTIALIGAPTGAQDQGNEPSAANGQTTGLPLPRFVSLAASEVNLRAGPGTRYPVRWVLQRRGMPIKIVGEDDVWRRVVDYEGTEGWIHASLLSSRRTVVVTGTTRELRRSASADARVVLRAEPGVIGTLLNCTSSWCLVEISDVRGWIERSSIWGVLDSEMTD